MTDMEARRESDRVLASLDKRLALVEQAQTLGAKTAEATAQSLSRQMEALGAEVRASLSVQATTSSDLSASPAGRAVIAALAERSKVDDDHNRRLDEVEGWVDAFKGSLSALRGLIIVTGGVAWLFSILATVIALQAGGPGQ